MTTVDGRLREAARAWLRRLPPPFEIAHGVVRGYCPAPSGECSGSPIQITRPGLSGGAACAARHPSAVRGVMSVSTPIDRVYIEDFLTRHAEDVQGACLEILNANYTNQFGAARVTSVDILDIDPANTAATIVADLGERDSLLRSGSTASSSRRRYT